MQTGTKSGSNTKSLNSAKGKQKDTTLYNVYNLFCSWCTDTWLQGLAGSLQWKKTCRLKSRRHQDKFLTTLFKIPALKSVHVVLSAPCHNWCLVLTPMVSYLTKRELLHNLPLKTEIMAVFQFSIKKNNATPHNHNYFPIYFILAPEESVVPSTS